MAQTSYEKLNSMETFEFISGTVYTLYFEMLDQEGAELDLTGGSVEVNISYLGQPETTVISLTGILDGTPNNTWSAVFETSDTEGLSGVFTVQPKVIDAGGDEFFPAQGRLIILPANAS